MHVPPLFHAEDLQSHVYAGSLYAESEPLHPVQIVALVHPVQVILQAKLLYENFYFLFYKYLKQIKNFHIIIIIHVHIPPLFHAVDLQTHVYAGSL